MKGATFRKRTVVAAGSLALAGFQVEVLFIFVHRAQALRKEGMHLRKTALFLKVRCLSGVDAKVLYLRAGLLYPMGAVFQDRFACFLHGIFFPPAEVRAASPVS